MVKEIKIDEYIEQLIDIPIIDVRSPLEYKHGHIPNALSIPLFTDEERAEVGTTYKIKTKEKAIELGYKFVNPKLDWYITESQKIAPKGIIAVHCWRGGMRSHSMAEHLSKNGFKTVYVIEGGYKAFRNYTLESFNNAKDICILGGYTGSGKTPILFELERSSKQVIDLEGIAHHKGSAFGRIGMSPQPTSEQFQNNVFWVWKDLDLTEPIWIEDESMNIGNVNIPTTLFEHMRNAPVYFLNIPIDERAKYLVPEYASSDNDDELIDAVQRISKRLGGLATKDAINSIESKEYELAAKLTLVYYDKYYLKGLNRRDADQINIIEAKDTNIVSNCQLALKQYQANINDNKKTK